jgi:hypothetical protein
MREKGIIRKENRFVAKRKCFLLTDNVNNAPLIVMYVHHLGDHDATRGPVVCLVFNSSDVLTVLLFVLISLKISIKCIL